MAEPEPTRRHWTPSRRADEVSCLVERADCYVHAVIPPTSSNRKLQMPAISVSGSSGYSGHDAVAVSAHTFPLGRHPNGD
jgi:hypothetical protein